jgi:hypothetical protein
MITTQTQIATVGDATVASVAPASGTSLTRLAGSHATEGHDMYACTNTDTIYLALRASSTSTIQDVFVETNLHGLALMIRGGLSATDIIILSDDRDATHDRAVSELQLRGGK